MTYEEWDIAAEDPVQRIDDRGRVVTLQGRPALDGTALAEDLIKKGLVERAKLRAKVLAAAKKLVKGEAKAGSGG
jgi:hypothetical protein